jgi:hypothetical protein
MHNRQLQRRLLTGERSNQSPERRYALKKATEEIRAKVAAWEKPEPKKPVRPVQLRLL